jgi:hypothetical protein
VTTDGGGRRRLIGKSRKHDSSHGLDHRLHGKDAGAMGNASRGSGCKMEPEKADGGGARSRSCGDALCARESGEIEGKRAGDDAHLHAELLQWAGVTPDL